jgi:hypothetical protein
MVKVAPGSTLGITIFIMVGFSSIRVSAPPLAGPKLHIVEENDWIVDTDRHYTQGLRLTYLLGEQLARNHTRLNRVALALPFSPRQVLATRMGFHLGQNMYPPDDTHRPQLHKTPYTGSQHLFYLDFESF